MVNNNKKHYQIIKFYKLKGEVKKHEASLVDIDAGENF